MAELTLADKIRQRRRYLGYPDSLDDAALDERISYEITREERWAREYRARYGADAPVCTMKVMRR